MANLGSDPGFQTFLRTLDSRRSMVEANKNRKIAGLLARRQLEMAEFGIQEEQQLGEVDDNFEDRGMFRSGGRLEDRADVIQNVNADRARSEFNLAEESSAANRSAASELAGLSTLQVQEENAARGRITQRELAMAAQARSERLAAEERSRWEAEQKRLQALYDRQASLVTSGSARPAARSYSTYTPPPTRRAPARSAPTRSNVFSRSTRLFRKPAPTRTNPVRSGNKIYY